MGTPMCGWVDLDRGPFLGEEVAGGGCWGLVPKSHCRHPSFVRSLRRQTECFSSSEQQEMLGPAMVTGSQWERRSEWRHLGLVTFLHRLS